MRSIFYDHAESHSTSVNIFTDGSKSDAGVGFGIIFPTMERSGTLSPSASIFTAELNGVLKAVKEIILSEETNFTIYCDSRSILQSLSQFNPRHPLVLEILEWLLLAKQRGKEVAICWVPAHVGVVGNEHADELAKTAASSVIPRNCKLPYRDLFPQIRESVQSKWQRHWEALRLTNKKMRGITSSTRPWHYSSMPRRWETALCRLRIGHTRLTHGYLMSANPQTFCMDCLILQTVEHLLVECPSLRDERDRFLAYGKVANSFKLERILSGEGDFSLRGLFGYLLHCGVLDKI